MSKPESNNSLSRNGIARKDAMLSQLQDELVSVHHKRRQRVAFVKGAAFVAVCVVAGLAGAVLLSKPDTNRRIAEGSANTLTSATRRFSVAVVSNVAGIDERCIVVNTDSSAMFETMTDDELLAMLAAVGKPSVLGKINGEVRVISDAPPVRKQVKTL